MISLFDTNSHSSINYCTYDGIEMKSKVTNLKYEDFVIDGSFYLSDPLTLDNLRSIKQSTNNCLAKVKNGFATLADKIFIGDFDLTGNYIIDVVKASTGKWTKCIFPYNLNSKIVSEEEI